MTPKQLADEFYGMAHDAAMNVMDIIQQESTCRIDMEHSYNEKGIHIDFMFRGEIDYSLIVPWEYLDDDWKIRTYYLRFKVSCINCKSITEIANNFNEKLKEITSSPNSKEST